MEFDSHLLSKIENRLERHGFIDWKKAGSGDEIHRKRIEKTLY